MEITKTTRKITVEEKEANLENIWQNQIAKIKEAWGEKISQDFIQQKKHLLNYCLQNIEDEYYGQDNKLPFIMVVPIVDNLDIKKYLTLLDKGGFFSSIKKESITTCHQKFPYFITGIEVGQNNSKNYQNISPNFIPPPKKGVNLEEMLAIAVGTDIFKARYITCTETKNKKTGEIPALGKIEDRPMLYWSKPELCLECGIPSKKRNFCSI